MTYFISIVDGETKRAIEAVGTSRLFYAGALKAFKRELYFVPHLRLKSMLDKPQIKPKDRPYENFTNTIMVTVIRL